MSRVSTPRTRPHTKHFEICIGGISHQTEPHILLTYFEQFGNIHHYNFTSPEGGGLVFITYENSADVDRCLANRPHRIDGRHLYVKRALPFDAEHPREHIESTRDLMIVNDCLNVDELFLKELREYFSAYGTLYACKCCRDENFEYILVEFADFDQVDRIILDKPHYFNDQELHIMKLTTSNRTLMNIKYSSNHHSIIQDACDVEDDQKFLKYEYNYKKDLSDKHAREELSEIDYENEILRLQDLLKKLSEDFIFKRQQLEDDCCEQLRKLNENANQTHRLQQDLEREYAKLLVDYESLKRENEQLNEQYLQIELENFEITTYYEQVLAEEKAKTAEYERKCTSSSPRLKSLSSNSSSPPIPAIPDDDDDD